jgi:hypothetical protein
MKIHGKYKVTVKIKLHTQPIRELIYDKVGKFVKETVTYYIFDGFRVRKANVIDIQEVVL